MKLTLRRLFVLVVLLCSYTVFRTVAQLQAPNGVDFKMTSSFVAENATFPAGSYNIKAMQDDLYTLIVSSSDGHSAFISCDRYRLSIPRQKPNLPFTDMEAPCI
jgi:hypothetical protein